MTDDQILELLRNDDHPLNKARKVFVEERRQKGKLPILAFELRKQEFESVTRILTAYFMACQDLPRGNKTEEIKQALATMKAAISGRN